MPLTIPQSQPEVIETGRSNPIDALAPEGERDGVGADTCTCDACQGPARDEMWSRWA